MRLFSTTSSRLVAFFVLLILSGSARAQQNPDKQDPADQNSTEQIPGVQSPEDDRLKSIDEEAKRKEAKTKPPFEIFRSQIAPFDILPYVKPNHWSTLSLELRSNLANYEGSLQSAPVTLRGQPQSVTFKRDARLIKEQRSRLSMQVFLPRIPRELGLELIRPDQIRADETTVANLRVLEPHQMLVVILSRKANDSYAKWTNLRAFMPTSSADDALSAERQRYYRLVLPQEPDKPVLSPHPLTWTVISHVIWDGLEPELLSPAQQSAMLDWIHWGGQLVLVGGAGPNFAALRESFLGPYLPADLSGSNSQLSEADLRPLAQAYPPVTKLPDPEEPQPEPSSLKDAYELFGKRYTAPVSIIPASNRPVFLTGLDPKPGSTVLPLGAAGDKLILAVESRVGRGRIQMLGINPTDPAFIAWPGIDTFVRRFLLRRPEEPMVRALTRRDGGLEPPRYQALSGQDLSWVRYLSRDLGSSIVPPSNNPDPLVGTSPGPILPATNLTRGPVGARVSGMGFTSTRVSDLPPPPPSRPVGDWVDDAPLPRLCRDMLEEASGLSIPSSTFVFRVILAYLLALVPLNWLVCRYLLGRKEWAWAVIPVLSMGFAIGVERAASFDLGFEAACDEIDILEIQGEYPRAHLTRFGSIYSSSRVQFAITYPDESTALALPFDSGRSLRGEDIIDSTFQTQPVPSLSQFRVQPRSYSMFRAEQMWAMDGSIRLTLDASTRSIINESEIDLHDAVLLDGSDQTFVLGDIAKGASVVIGTESKSFPSSTSAKGPLQPDQIIKLIHDQKLSRPEEQGTLRLIAWSPGTRAGQEILPALDRSRGFTLVVANLSHGLPPSPDGPQFDALARGADLTPISDPPNQSPGSPSSKVRQFQIR